MIFMLICRNLKTTEITRCRGMVLLKMCSHFYNGNWLIAHITQLDVTKTVTLVQFKGRHIDGTLAE